MKKNTETSTRKLTLSTETIRLLTDSSLERVAGGRLTTKCTSACTDD